MTFQRESRYIVVKLKDLAPGQEADIREHLTELSAQPVDSLVIERDWPEYEPAWRMIQARVEGATLSPAHIEDGEEVEVVAWQYRLTAGPQTGWSLWNPGKGEEFENSYTVERRPLMTVAQHQRIVAARASRAAAHIENERKAFSAWASTQKWFSPETSTHRAFHYTDDETQAVWSGWQARAALSAPPAADGMCNADNPASRCECREEFGHRVCAAPPAAGVLEQMSSEARSTLVGMVEFCLNRRYCMGMDEGFASFDPDVEHDFVKELRAFAEGAPTPPASEQQRAVFSIPDLDEHLLEILGRPNFRCSHIAQVLRIGGAEIDRKSEHEQAAVIHWMLTLYLAHGAKWWEVATEEVKRIQSEHLAKGEGV